MAAKRFCHGKHCAARQKVKRVARKWQKRLRGRRTEKNEPQVAAKVGLQMTK